MNPYIKDFQLSTSEQIQLNQMHSINKTNTRTSQCNKNPDSCYDLQVEIQKYNHIKLLDLLDQDEKQFYTTKTNEIGIQNKDPLNESAINLEQGLIDSQLKNENQWLNNQQQMCYFEEDCITQIIYKNESSQVNCSKKGLNYLRVIQNSKIYEKESRRSEQCNYNEQKIKKQVKVFENESTKVTIQYNEEIKQYTVKKYLKKINFQSFQKEKNILQLFSQKQITPKLISSSESSPFWYEQIAGKNDFKVLSNFDGADCLDYSKYIQNMKILFCKLYHKLDQIFELGYAHSDIKPQNIILGFDFEPYLIDFGGTVELNNYKHYLNQYTRYFNHPKYLNESDDCNTYIFQNEEEIKQCDRQQLTISFLYMLTRVFENEYRKSYDQHDNILLLNYYFLVKDFNKLIQIISLNRQNRFDSLEQINFQKNWQNGIQIDCDIISILNLIEQPDNYEKIKPQIYEIAQRKIDNSIFEIIQNFSNDDILQSILKYDLKNFQSYISSRDNIENPIIKNGEILFIQNPQDHRILLNLHTYILSIKKDTRNTKYITIQKGNQEDKLINELQISYDRRKQYIDIKITDLKDVKQFKEQINQCEEFENLLNIGQKFINLIDQVKKEDANQNIYQELLKHRNQILIDIIGDVKYQFTNFCNYFDRNKLTVYIHEQDILNDYLFKEIYRYTNSKIGYELVFIDCRFKNDLFTQIHRFIQSYKNYHISYKKKQTKLDYSQVKCNSSFENEMDEVQKQQQKKFINIQFIESENRKYNDISQSNINDKKNILNTSLPFCTLLSHYAGYYLQIFLKKYLQNLKNLNISFLKKFREKYDEIIVINEHDFFNFFIGKYYEDPNVLKQKIQDNFVIIELNKIQILMSDSKSSEIKSQFIYYDYFRQRDDVLIISILGQKITKQIYKSQFEKIIKQQNKLRNIQSLFPYLPIDMKYHKNIMVDYDQNDLKNLLFELELKPQFLQDFNGLYYSYISSIKQFDTFQQKDLIQQFYLLFYKERSWNYFQREFIFRQKNGDLNYCYLSQLKSAFLICFKHLHYSFIDYLSEILVKKQKDNMINGQLIYEQLQQRLNYQTSNYKINDDQKEELDSMRPQW